MYISKNKYLQAYKEMEESQERNKQEDKEGEATAVPGLRELLLLVFRQ
jgi:hypothetical protein